MGQKRFRSHHHADPRRQLPPHASWLDHGQSARRRRLPRFDQQACRDYRAAPPRPREWLCAIDLSPDSERVLRFAHDSAVQGRAKLHIIHAIQGGDPNLRHQFGLAEQLYSAEAEQARQRIAQLQHEVGSDAPVRVVVGSVKDALLEAAQLSDADALLIGRSPHSGGTGRLRDLTYAIVRDSPFPVVSV